MRIDMEWAACPHCGQSREPGECNPYYRVTQPGLVPSPVSYTEPQRPTDPVNSGVREKPDESSDTRYAFYIDKRQRRNK